MYNDIVCFKFIKRLDIDNIELIFLLIKYKEKFTLENILVLIKKI